MDFNGVDASPDSRPDASWTGPMLLARCGKLDQLPDSITHDPLLTNSTGETVFLIACKYGHADQVPTRFLHSGEITAQMLLERHGQNTENKTNVQSDVREESTIEKESISTIEESSVEHLGSPSLPRGRNAHLKQKDIYSHNNAGEERVFHYQPCGEISFTLTPKQYEWMRMVKHNDYYTARVHPNKKEILNDVSSMTGASIENIREMKWYKEQNKAGFYNFIYSKLKFFPPDKAEVLKNAKIQTPFK